jgi:uncharacterized membrane protein YebE (DUF533 family)
MSGLTDILGSLIQAGISPSGNQRMRNTIGAGGQPSSNNGLDDILGNIGGVLSGMSSNAPGTSAGSTGMQGNTNQSGGGFGGLGDILGQMTKGASSGGTGGSSSAGGGGGGGFGGLGNILGGAIGEIGRSLGSGNKVAAGGLGALIGSLFGGGGSSAKGAVGGGVMAVLASLAYSALKNAGSAPSRAPVGLLENQTAEQKTEMDHEADLAIRAMVNAAKADGHIDDDEMQRIIGQLQKDGVEDNERQHLIAEMQKPLDLNGLVNAAKDDPQVAAQVYIASLLAIEVDTDAERNYLKALADGLGLPDQAVSHIEMAMGMR